MGVRLRRRTSGQIESRPTLWEEANQEVGEIVSHNPCRVIGLWVGYGSWSLSNSIKVYCKVKALEFFSGWNELFPNRCMNVA